jgi:RimJ/RimL family protein N-acetyltransferase
MSGQTPIPAPRLLLRPFRPDDAPAVQRLAGDRDIALTTINVPHPYEDGMAEAWIATHADLWTRGAAVICAMEHREQARLVGAVGITIELEQRRGELGYWVGKPWWGNGYATEAARALVGFAFERLGLERVFAHHFASNPASGRVMQKIGMRQEGVLRRHVIKWGRFENIVVYGILAEEFTP